MDQWQCRMTFCRYLGRPFVLSAMSIVTCVTFSAFTQMAHGYDAEVVAQMQPRVTVCHHGCVVVHINDREALVGRHLDLTPAAARAKFSTSISGSRGSAS
jgi:hypothetical protein